MARRKFREKSSKFYGTKQVLQDLNAPAHTAVHDLDAAAVQLPGGGLAGQVLIKNTDADFDVSWGYITEFPPILDGGAAPTVAVDSIIDGNSANAAHSNTLDGGDA
jgi:hypothetical protein